MTIAHVVPSTPNDQTPHELGAGACWCQPLVETETTGGRMVIHRRYIDGPARDHDDDRGWSVIKAGDTLLS